MSQHNVSDSAESLTAAAYVPLSERPLVAEDENTVISTPEQARKETRGESTAVGDGYRQRLFPPNGNPNGEEAGICLAHFEISQRLGAGGMGAVFRAADLELARDVALKILHPAASQDASLVARFRNEARACAQLNHDNIARVFYAGSQDGLHFIAYEFASGQTIRDLIIQRGRLSIEDTVNYAIQVTLALNHIAAAGIVHRDIKPSNIMLTSSGRVKVVDLGLARRDVTDSIGDITVAGTTLGTFDYIAPEQARDPRNADVRSDIYSLGCTMFHMLTGRPPYPEGTALQKLLDHQGRSAPDPRLNNPGVPAELAAIMRKMMANHPDHRYQSPGLLLNDLIQLASVLGLHSVPAEGIVWRKVNPASQRQPLGAVWVFVSVLLICVTAILLQRASRFHDSAEDLSGDGESLGKLVSVDSYTENRIDKPPTIPSGEKSSEGASATFAAPVAQGVASSPSGSAAPSATDAPVIASPTGANFPPNVRVPMTSIPNEGPISPALIDLILATPQPGLSPAITVNEQSGPFIRQSSDGRARSFRTLKAAVADARSGDVILLRYNGYPDDLPAQPPVRIVGMNLIIRAADGFRPTLQFEGISEGTVSPGQMFSLRSQGSLTMRDIDLRLLVRDDLTTDRWSLFHCAGSNRIQLENVSIECRNPEGQPAALFDLTDESAGPLEDNRPESEFTLSRVICRADADGFRIACQPHGRIQLKNCAFTLNGRLIELRGDTSMQPSRGALEVFLEHVTCVHSAPLIHMSDGDERKATSVQRTLPQLSIRSEASVFAGTGPDPCLLSSVGNSYLEDIESLVTWNGFTNLYDGYSVFWQIETSALDYSSRRLDFIQWKELWNVRSDSEDTSAEVMPLSAWRNALWRSAAPSISLQSVNPSTFELQASLFIPGPQSLPLARDGLIPGVNPQELPPFPRSTPSISSGPAVPPPVGAASAERPKATEGAASSIPPAVSQPVLVQP
jgi:serine/threonine-protein kinase